MKPENGKFEEEFVKKLVRLASLNNELKDQFTLLRGIQNPVHIDKVVDEIKRLHTEIKSIELRA